MASNTFLGQEQTPASPRELMGKDSGTEGTDPGEEVVKVTQAHLLVATVPLPGVAWPVGEKVCCALVFHTLGETQQHSEVVVGGLGGIGCAVGTGREIGMAL